MMRNLARSALRSVLLQSQQSPYEVNERHVLLIRPDHLGDLLFARPAISRFRAALPDWHITLAVGPWSRAVVEHEPNIDQLVEIPFPGFDRGASKYPWQPYQQLFMAAEQVRTIRPAAVVVMRDDHWWGGLLARRAGVPTIIGASRPEMAGLLTDAVPISERHWVARNVEMLEFAARRLSGQVADHLTTPASDPLIWKVAENDRAAADNILTTSGVTNRFVVIHPGSGAPVKLWPARRWARVAEALAEDGLDVVLTGSQSEIDYLHQIESESRARLHSVAGRTSLPELAGIFDKSLLVAGVDSGPLHLAVAVGRPTVHIYGPSDATTYGPWGDPRNHRIISAGLHCRSCGDLRLSRPAGAGCMVAVGEDEVITTIRELLPQ